MIELVRDLRVINVLAKFENDPWKIMDVRVLTGLVCPAARPPARPLGVRQYPGALKGCGVTIATLPPPLYGNIPNMSHHQAFPLATADINGYFLPNGQM